MQQEKMSSIEVYTRRIKEIDGLSSKSSVLVFDIPSCQVLLFISESSKQSLNNIVSLQEHSGSLMILWYKM